MNNEHDILEFTNEFIAAVEEGANALINAADDLKKCPEYTLYDNIGTIVKRAAERNYQRADLLHGWLKRIKEKQ